MASTQQPRTGFRLKIEGKGSSTPLSLSGNRWLIGRHPDCDIHLSDPLVSRRHGLLYLENGALILEDLSPRNPTKVNGKEILGPAHVGPGDEIQVGDTLIRIQSMKEMSIRVRPGHLDLDSKETLVHPLPEDLLESDEVLKIVNDLADSLIPVSTQDDAADLTLDLIRNSLPVRSALIARSVTPRRMRILASFGLRNPEKGFEVPKGLIRLLGENQGTVCLEHPSAEDLGTTEPFWDSPPSQIFLAPIRTRAGITGFLYLEKDDGAPPCSPRDLALTSALIRIFSSRLDILDLVDRLMQENVELKQRKLGTSHFLGASAEIRDLMNRAGPLARKRDWLAVLGEPGSGREAFIHNIHSLSLEEAEGKLTPFVVVEAGMVEEDEEIHEELFGSEDRDVLRLGKALAAHGGTLVIRDIDRTSLSIQAMLVETLRRGRVERNGSSESLDVRLAVTSSKDRKTLFESGLLHPELAARIEPRVFEIPPLRSRPEDVALLASHFLEEIASRSGRPPARLSPRALDRLRAYHWPGNVRELRETMATAVILARGHTIYPKHLPRHLGGMAPGESTIRLPDLPSLDKVEKEHILYVLSTVGGNKVRAAEILGIAYSTLYAKLRKYADEEKASR